MVLRESVGGVRLEDKLLMLMPYAHNQIPEHQNADRFLNKLAASSQLYSQAKLLAVLQVLLTVVVPVTLSILVIIFTNQKVWAAFYGLVLSVIDLLLFQKLQDDWKKEAAGVQESFDCELLEMDWNEFKASEKPTPEAINRAAGKYLTNETSLAKLRDWYSPRVGDVPLYLARIICQRTNIVWDSSLRKLYASWLIVLTVVVVIILISIGLILRMNLETLILSIMAPISPTVLWSIREVRKQNQASDTLRRLKTYVQKLWSEACQRTISESDAASRSRELQDEIYVHRCSNQPIFNWIHRLTKNKYEDDMNVAAEELVNEALKNKDN